MFNLTPPMEKVEAKTALADWNPSMSSIFGLCTPSAINLVTPRLTPCRMKNVPSVTRKLGRPVTCNSQPLNAPMANDTTSPISTPTQTFIPKYQAVIEAESDEVNTPTPADRSNSPPIMSSDTGTAIRPMVEQ